MLKALYQWQAALTWSRALALVLTLGLVGLVIYELWWTLRLQHQIKRGLRK